MEHDQIFLFPGFLFGKNTNPEKLKKLIDIQFDKAISILLLRLQEVGKT